MNESGERLSLKKIVLMRATKMEQVNLDHQIHQYRQIHQNNQNSQESPDTADTADSPDSS